MIRNVTSNPLTIYDLFFRNFYDSNSQWLDFNPDKDKASIPKPPHPVDIYSTDTHVVFEIACVGIEKEHVEVFRGPDTIRVKYSKPTSGNDGNDIVYLTRSISRKSFDLGWKLSAKYDIEKMSVNLDKGLLTIKVPLREGEQIHKVEIQ